MSGFGREEGVEWISINIFSKKLSFLLTEGIMKRRSLMFSYLIFQLISEFDPATMTVPASVPESARDLIRQLLAKDPTQRITHANIFVRAIVGMMLNDLYSTLLLDSYLIMVRFLFPRFTHSSQGSISPPLSTQKHH